MSLKIITLDNGLRIALERNDNARTCSLGAWVASGSAYETAQTAGVSHFIEHMLFRGTESRTSLDIAEQMDEIRLHGEGAYLLLCRDAARAYDKGA